MSSSILNNQRGAGKLTTLVFGALLAIVVFCAYNILPFYYYYYELVNQFESHVRVASVYTDTQLRSKLMYHIRKMEIRCNPEDLIIERYDGNIRIALKYQEVFYVTLGEKDYDLYTFDFDAEASGPIE